MSDAQAAASGTLRSEHRSLAAVIHNMKTVLQAVRAGRMAMDYPLFWAMVHCIDGFSNRFHHPKEADWLFARLKLRTSEADALIDELQAQHQDPLSGHPPDSQVFNDLFRAIVLKTPAPLGLA